MKLKTIRRPGRFSYIPHRGQIRFHVSKARYRILVCGRRFGKTKAAAAEIYFHLYGYPPKLTRLMKQLGLLPRDWKWTPPSRPQQVCVVAPSYRATKKLEKAFRAMFPKRLIANHSKSEHIYYLKAQGLEGFHTVEFYSAKSEESLVGDGYDLLILDETGDILEEIWNERLRATISDRLGRVVLIGTPRGKNWFHVYFLRGLDPLWEQYESWQMPSWMNPYFPKSEWYDAQRDLPEAIFEQEYKGAFLDDAASVFRKVDEAIVKGFRGEEPMKGARYKLGGDLARTVDFTVYSIVRRLRTGRIMLNKLIRFNQRDWSVQKTALVETIKEWNKCKVTLDGTGVGDPFAQDLKAAGFDVESIVFNNTNKKNLINNLAIGFEKGIIALPDPDLVPEVRILIEELKAYRYEITKHGNITYNAPHGKHDDCVISLALAVWGLEKVVKYSSMKYTK